MRLEIDALEPRSRLILPYATCGFANFGSLGIMIAGLATRRRNGATTMVRTHGDRVRTACVDGAKSYSKLVAN